MFSQLRKNFFSGTFAALVVGVFALLFFSISPTSASASVDLGTAFNLLDSDTLQGGSAKINAVEVGPNAIRFQIVTNLSGPNAVEDDQDGFIDGFHEDWNEFTGFFYYDETELGNWSSLFEITGTTGLGYSHSGQNSIASLINNGLQSVNALDDQGVFLDYSESSNFSSYSSVNLDRFYWFFDGDTSQSPSASRPQPMLSQSITFSYDLTGLDPSTTYYYRLRFEEEGDSDSATTTPKNETTLQTGGVPNQTTYGESEEASDAGSIGDEANTISTVTDPASNLIGDLQCELLGDSPWVNCLVQAVNYAFYKPSTFFAAISGKVFDYFISFTIDDTSYRNTFINRGWTIVRDFSNIFFIFILLYAAIKMMLPGGGGSAGKTIKNLIVIALLINFSLFATRVIIDGTNILAHVFYNTISEGASQATTINGEPVQEISEGITDGLSLQKIFTPQLVEAFEEDENFGLNATTVMLIVILGGVMNFTAAWAMFSVALVMVARTIGLWLGMILVPLVLIGYMIPNGVIARLEPNRFWKEFVNLALVAPIFLFFMFLILQFISSGFLSGALQNPSSSDFLAFFLNLAFPFVLIIGLLLIAKKTTIEMAGELGKMAVTATTKTLGFAGAVAGGAALAATGVGAVAARGALGRAGASLAESRGLKDLEQRGINTNFNEANWYGRLGNTAARKFGQGVGSAARNTAKSARDASFDMRDTTVGQKVSALAGQYGGKQAASLANTLSDNKLLGILDARKEDGKGGFSGAKERKEKEIQEKQKEFLLTDKEAAAQDKEHEAWREEYLTALSTAQERANTLGVELDTQDFYEQYKANPGAVFTPKDETGAAIAGMAGAFTGVEYVNTAAEENTSIQRKYEEDVKKDTPEYIAGIGGGGALGAGLYGLANPLYALGGAGAMGGASIRQAAAESAIEKMSRATSGEERIASKQLEILQHMDSLMAQARADSNRAHNTADYSAVRSSATLSDKEKKARIQEMDKENREVYVSKVSSDIQGLRDAVKQLNRQARAAAGTPAEAMFRNTALKEQKKLTSMQTNLNYLQNWEAKQKAAKDKLKEINTKNAKKAEGSNK